MNDLISRQAAIDKAYLLDLSDTGNNIEIRVIDASDIEQLPSAHLEADEWCTDCPAYDHEKHYCPRFRKVIRRTVQEIEEERIPEHSAWFRISETLVSESKGDITAEQAVDKIRDYMRKMEKPGRKKGKWFLTDTMYACDQCHSVFYETSPFCPMCGADMQGEQDSFCSYEEMKTNGSDGDK